MDIIDILNWRYATKRMNGKKISKEDLDVILEAIRLSASSIGLQPYKILVTENKELLEKILPIANNQVQITECSHLLIFAAWNNLTDERIDNWIKMIQDQRGAVLERLTNFATHLKTKSKNTSEEDNFVWITKQVYIALGNAMIAAASLKIDATPMEGFNPVALDELLELNKQGLKSVLLLPIGYRDEANDFLLKEKKVRRPKEEFIEYIK